MANANAELTSRTKRALIIGNNNYSRPESRLLHCINDADDLSASLQKIGFNVTTHHDLTAQKMVEVVFAFGQSIVDGDLVLFYFSGHGYQVNDENYLVPVNDEIITNNDAVESFAFGVRQLLTQLPKKNKSYVTIIILDCCRIYLPRDEPMPRGFAGTGLKMVNAPCGTIVQFACDANQAASDGNAEDRNGLFTKHLLHEISNSKEDVIQIFQCVAGHVVKESKGKQHPLTVNKLTNAGRIYLAESKAIRKRVDQI